MSKECKIDVPEHWDVVRYKKTGHGKLIAQFKWPPAGWEINIVPYKSYSLPGFTNCHRVTLTKGDSVEVIAEGMKVEHREEAEDFALEAMKELSDKD